ncbi:Erythromycin esterase [Planococcus massiliensis]|uniref:Erythromycin esterase n=1 Tax=Planococcus massiliensis TaxID=1499687 RepID=A0A098EQU7_9BACL|nr:erythromycin esterase family protein [Planococcus massiliensis]CEG24172.1 Erythromycin esterase [Planococcus massiliensis]
MDTSLEQAVVRFAEPFHSAKDLSTIVEAVGDAKIVMLGEASHGTSDFYTVRAELSRKLIQEKGFTLVAVEGDWPSAQQVNRFIKGFDENGKSAHEIVKSFTRWPTWMWANEEMADFIGWLKEYNNQNGRKTGFYGIDIYSLWESMEEVIHYLTHTNPSGGDLELAKKAFSCFEPFNREPENYAISYASFSTICIEEVSKLLSSIRSNEELYKDDWENDLNLKINALVAKNAEDYYRAMVQSGEVSWNIRDEHMVEAINEIRDYHGRDAKIIIWEHNTHIGDARATDMKNDGMINVGQVLREQNRPEDVFALGFGTYEGTVVASEAWGTPHRIMEVPPARLHSWEEIFHRTGPGSKYVVFNEQNRKAFDQWAGHRAIGVVYHPEFESRGNYVPTRLSKRYDAFIYLEKTKALTPIQVENTVQ